MAGVTDIGTLITQTPGIHGGRPHIAGTGVTVRRIAIWYRLGYSAEEIVREIDHLTLAQVHAALAYYHANREMIEADIAAEEAEAERLEGEHNLSLQPVPLRLPFTSTKIHKAVVLFRRYDCEEQT